MATLEVSRMSSAPVIPDAGEDVASKTFHVSLRFHRFGTSKKVQVSQISIVGETETNTTDKSMVSANKKILKCPELKAIETADREFGAWVDGLCLPFDTGVRLLPRPAVEIFCSKAREFTTKRKLLVQSFMAVYNTEAERGKRKLGPLGKETDYPPAEWVEDQFSFSYQFFNFGTPADLKNINPDIFAEERDKAARQLEDAASIGQTMLLTTFAEMITRLKTSLQPTEDGKKRKLYDTAVTNLQEFVSTFNLRNVSNYRELEAQVARAKEALANINTDQIKESDTLRTYVSKTMNEIEATLQPMVTTRTRKMRLNEPAVQ